MWQVSRLLRRRRASERGLNPEARAIVRQRSLSCTDSLGGRSLCSRNDGLECHVMPEPTVRVYGHDQIFSLPLSVLIAKSSHGSQ